MRRGSLGGGGDYFPLSVAPPFIRGSMQSAVGSLSRGYQKVSALNKYLVTLLIYRPILVFHAVGSAYFILCQSLKCVRLCCWVSLVPLQWAFFTAGILTCHRRKSTGVTNNITDGSVPVSGDRAILHNASTLKLKQLNGIQPSFI